MHIKYKTFTNSGLDATLLFLGQDQCKSGYIYPGNNIRNNYVLHYIEKGSGLFASANHQITKLHKGDCFLLPKNVACFYQADTVDPWKYSWIGLDGINVPTLLNQTQLGKNHYLRNVQGSNFFKEYQKIFQTALSSHSLNEDILIKSYIYKMFYFLNTEFSTKSKTVSPQSNSLLRQSINYLEENFSDSHCNINQLAQQLDVSRTYLYSIFKKYLGYSPQQFLLKMRIEKSKHLLKNSKDSVQSIAFQVGYKDEFTFSKAFKRYTGISPSLYRKSKLNN